MATAKPKGTKEAVYEWEGKDRNGKQVRGEIRAVGENQVLAALRRQGVTPDLINPRRGSTEHRTGRSPLQMIRIGRRRRRIPPPPLPHAIVFVPAFLPVAGQRPASRVDVDNVTSL